MPASTSASTTANASGVSFRNSGKKRSQITSSASSVNPPKSAASHGSGRAHRAVPARSLGGGSVARRRLRRATANASSSRGRHVQPAAHRARCRGSRSARAAPSRSRARRAPRRACSRRRASRARDRSPRPGGSARASRGSVMPIAADGRAAARTRSPVAQVQQRRLRRERRDSGANAPPSAGST